MNNCEIIKDLLPLYQDKVVSTSSIEMIEEHLKTCEDCKAELAKMQGEVKVSFNSANKAEVGAFRLFKIKILRKNVLVACTSVVLAAALLLGTYVYLDRNTTIIPMSDELFVELKTNIERGVINIVSSVKPGGVETGTIFINENGKIVKLVFMVFTESTISKWRSNHDGNIEYSYIVAYPVQAPQPNPEDKPGANLIFEPFDRCEVYYINKMVSEVNLEKDYQDLRRDGTLIWSGALE